MGVLTEHVDSKFHLAREHFPAVIEAMKQVVREAARPNEYVNLPDQLLSTSDIAVAFDAVGFVVTFDARGDIDSLRWGGDKLPFDTTTLYHLFKSFAKLVQSGSYLEIEEEDARCRMHWRGIAIEYSYHGRKPHEAMWLRARDASRAGDHERAARLLRDAVELREDYDYGWNDLAIELAHLRRWDEAMAACERTAVDASCWREVATLARNAGDSVMAMRFVDAGLPRMKADYAQSLLRTEGATSCSTLSRFERALELAREAQAQSPNANAAYEECSACFDLARYAESVEAAKRTRNMLKTMILRAEAYVMLGKKTDARKWFEKVLVGARKERAKGSYVAWHATLESHVAFALGQHEEAMKAARDALAISPDWAYPLHRLGVAQLAQKRLDEARTTLVRVNERSIGWDFGLYDLARALIAAGQREEAREILAGVTRRNPHLAVLVARAASEDDLPPANPVL
jgi:tetratricopeptide (TPR) repeat protein